MKLYEKMGIDPTTEEGMAKILTLHCDTIPDDISKENKIDICVKSGMGESCSTCKAKRLFAEVPTKKVQRIATYSDAVKAAEDYGKSATRTSFVDWLSQEIEVEV